MPMGETAELRRDGPVAVIMLCHAPVNALSRGVRAGLLGALAQAVADDSVRGIVVCGAGGNFSAGADVSEFATGAALAAPTLVSVVTALDGCPKPVACALEGNVLGGGLEVALACHWRLAAPSARLGFPEVQLGLLPGAGGTQRAPRLVGVPTAVAMVTTGAPVPAATALESGLVDRLLRPPPGQTRPDPPTSGGRDGAVSWVVHEAVRFLVDNILWRPGLLQRPQASALAVPGGAAEHAAVCNAARAKLPPADKGGRAPRACVDAVAAACQGSFAAGMRHEQDAFLELAQSAEAAALVHLFAAQRCAGRMTDRSTNDAAPAPATGAVATAVPVTGLVGVVGGGVMGSGIAASLLLAAASGRGAVRGVVLTERDADALERGRGAVRRAVWSVGKRRGWADADVDRAMALLTTTVAMQGLAQCDVVIEAVFESLEVKRGVFSQLAQACRPDAVLCTNTSTLDVDAIAAAVPDPACRRQVLGMHFFSPAHVMKLVEVVRGGATSSESLQRVLALTRAMGKVGVIVGNCDGFVGNRVLDPMGAEAGFMLEEGASPAQLDASMRAFGMAMGPCEMADLSGNDIGYSVRRERGLLDPLRRPPGVRYCALADKLCEMGRFGQKVGRGWYRYTKQGSRAPQDDPEVAALLANHRAEAGLAPRADISDREITERCLLPLVNEAFRTLEEGVLAQPSDLDVIYVLGYGFPPWRGGPLHWAEHQVGLRTLLEKLEAYSRAFPSSPHWVPSTLLRALVYCNSPLRDWRKHISANRRPAARL